jgi:DNA-binding IscR family transcriptional regulator
MRMSSGVEWASHCCVVLSRADGPVSTARLAEFYDVSPTYLAKQL